MFGWFRRAFLFEQPLSFLLHPDLARRDGREFREAILARASQIAFVVPTKIKHGRTSVRIAGRGGLLPHAWRFEGTIKTGTSAPVVTGWLCVAGIPRAFTVFLALLLLAICVYGAWIVLGTAQDVLLDTSRYSQQEVLGIVIASSFGILLANSGLLALTILPFRRRLGVATRIGYKATVQTPTKAVQGSAAATKGLRRPYIRKHVKEEVTRRAERKRCSGTT